MGTRRPSGASGSDVESRVRRRLALAGGSALLAVAIAAPEAEAARRTQPEVAEPKRDVSARALAARESLLAPETEPATGGAPVQLTGWGNWHNWGYHPWWHNWPNWRNWHNWRNW